MTMILLIILHRELLRMFMLKKHGEQILVVYSKPTLYLSKLTKNGSYIGNAALATRLTAEARFLRAFFYFDLVKYYGKVPTY